MAHSTEPTGWRITAGLLALLSLSLAPGCATPRLLEVSARTERAVSYRQAWTDGERLWLRYETERLDAHGRRVGGGVREASLALADTDPRQGTPIDALPIEHLEASQIPLHGLEALAVASAPNGPGPTLLVVRAAGRHESFRLLHVPGQPEGASVPSGALVQRHTAWWAWPLLPLTLVYDAAVVPFVTLVSLPFLLGD